jgi:hypothetical protein
LVYSEKRKNKRYFIVIFIYLWYYRKVFEENFMTKFIGMEYLVALALIQQDKEEISLADLNQFRVKVVKAFKDNEITSVFLFSDNYAMELVRNYSDCFELINNDAILRRKVSNDVLISRFLAYLSNDVLKAAFTSEKLA